MQKNEIEDNLTGGGRLGLIKLTNSDKYLGWILLTKILRAENTISNFHFLDPIEDKEIIDSDLNYIAYVRDNPYQVRIIELKKEVHESGVYETEEDYRMNIKHHFSSLDRVEQFLTENFHFDLKDMRPSRELDAP